MSPLFRRNPATPPTVPGLDLAPGERILATGETASGTLVATTHRLVIPVDDGVRAIGWEDVECATWDGEADQLVVLETAPLGARPRQHRLHLREASPTVLDVLREQVTASVVVSRHIPLVGAKGIRVSGRRRTGAGGLVWRVAVDPGIDVGDLAVRAAVDEAIARVRAEVE
jgi:hypothetical protein